MDTNIHSHSYREHKVRHRASDGYISATDMCKVKKGKLFADYNRLKKTQEHLCLISQDTGIPMPELIDIQQGGIPQEQGTWVHPRVATHLAMWISRRFEALVSGWVDEWKTYSQVNVDRYNYELDHLEPSCNSQLETELRDELAVRYDGRTEVECASGRADVVTIKTVIEVKRLSDWKHALGQVLSYSIDLDRKPVVCLFTEIDGRAYDITTEEADKLRPYFDRFGIDMITIWH